MATELIYTDGACTGNGTSRSKGGYGIFIAKSTISPKPLKINKKCEKTEFNNETFFVTNIRMEGLAIVSSLALYANLILKEQSSENVDIVQFLNDMPELNVNELKTNYTPNELKVYHSSKDVSIEIVTDSLFWINVIESWMPSWVRKGMIMQKKNPDILLMMLYYTELLKQNCINVILTHVRSHQKGKRSSHADGNDIADVLATSSVGNPTTKFYLQ